MSRSRRALLNTTCEILLEVVTAICGLILPRLILSHFGSSYNGITHSISQFISCIALLKSGIGSVTRAALYKPLAERDSYKISEVVNATEGFLRRVAGLFGGFIVVFAALYPFIVAEDFSWTFAFTLTLIISISTFAQYFFGLTYQMVLQADQANYIISLVQIGSIVVNTVLASLLVVSGFGIHAVKFASAVVFVVPPIFYMLYVRKKYRIDKNVPANKNLISQRWDAFGHQLAHFINYNTDVMVTTVILGVKEVSVYSVHYAIANAIRKAVIAVSSGTQAAFGNMLAKDEKDILRKRFHQYELMTFLLGTVLFTIASILYCPFISIYTRGITDVEYHRPILAILFCIAEFMASVKLPYEMIVYAAGDFKQTKKAAYVEAGINIILSVSLALLIGLYGILLGTIAAGVYRVLKYNNYVSKNLIVRSPWSITKKFIYAAVNFVGCYIIASALPLNSINSYLQWAMYAIPICFSVVAVCVFSAFLFFGEDTKELLKTIINILFGKLKRQNIEAKK